MMRNKAAQSNPGILELKNNYENGIIPYSPPGCHFGKCYVETNAR
jgi:hypothetical protein